MTDLLSTESFAAAAIVAAGCPAAGLDFGNGIHYKESDSYEWDDAKAEANFWKHKVRFEHAVEACEDFDAVVEHYFGS